MCAGGESLSLAVRGVADVEVVGSIGSEFVQALLPYKTFQWGDVVVSPFLFIPPRFPGRTRNSD